MSTVNTAPARPATGDIHNAIDAVRHAGVLIHAAWMAAGSLPTDEHGAEREALQAVLHLAGESVDDAAYVLKLTAVVA